MTPEQYLTKAKELVADGRYEQATAYASLATATAAVATMQASAPPALYPGEHAPPLIEWCGKCQAPGRRVKFTGYRGEKQLPCAECSYDAQPEVRPCRYCLTYIKTDSESRSVRNSTWADSRGSRWCPNAPEPTQPQQAGEEADLTPDSLWMRFFHSLSIADTPQSTEGLIAAYRTGYFFPVTRYDQVPTADQLDRWLQARLGKVYVSKDEQIEFRLVQKTGRDGELLWSATREGSL